ncbi:MAG: glycosyltransferase family 2 protein [Gemmatimonadota bacterium]
MSEVPLVSVVMSVFNGERDIPVALGDILGQTLSSIEVIAIDDGSRDGSHELLQRASGCDGRLRVLRQPNKGIASALAAGCRLARGRYIARMDVDDRSHPRRLEKQVQLMEGRADVVACGTWALQAMSGSEPDIVVAPPDDHEQLAAALAQGANPFVHGSMMFRTRDYRRLSEGYRIPGFSEDYDVWLRLMKHGRLAMVTEPMYLYHLTPSGLTFGALSIEPRVRELCLRLHREREVDGVERTDWRREIVAVLSAARTSVDSETRATSVAWAKALRSLRGGRMGEFRAALDAAAAGSGPRARRARRLRRLAWASPVLRQVLNWRIARAGDRYSRPIESREALSAWPAVNAGREQ